MKILQKLVVIGVGLFSMTFNSYSKGQESSQRLYFGVVSKEDRTPFLYRMATPSGRVIVTTKPLSQEQGISVKLGAKENLYGVELLTKDVRALFNQVFRYNQIAFFVAKSDEEAEAHVHQMDDLSHPFRIELEELKFDEKSQKNLTHSSIQNNFQDVVIDTKQMREDLESLSGARPVVIDGKSVTITQRNNTEMKNYARKWLRGIYEGLGYKVTEHKYGAGINLVAEKKAQSDDQGNILVVSAHLDTVATAGADDDGSGVISSLTIARALSQKQVSSTLRFVAFDEEEKGLLGSKAYAKELSRTGEIGRVQVFNIEMTGYDSNDDGKYHVIDCNENQSANLSRVLRQAIQDQNIKLQDVEACTNRSDHASFWQYNRPAIVISQNFFGGDANPCYHRSCDTVQKFNWDYMARLTKASAVAVGALVGAQD